MWFLFKLQGGPGMGRGGFGGRGGGRGGFSPGGPGRGMGRGGGFDGRFEDHTTYAVPAEKCGLVIGKGKYEADIV